MRKLTGNAATGRGGEDPRRPVSWKTAPGVVRENEKSNRVYGLQGIEVKKNG